MLLLNSTVNNFEKLPDELILLICRYLSSTDVLISFYNLNSRLTQTISGFYQHVVLGQVSFKHFNYLCTSILPNISTNIRTLVVSNDWKGVLSKIFLKYFGEKMSLLFPHLKRLILATFRISSLLSFIDCLHNLPELNEIQIMSLYEMGTKSIKPELLLQTIFNGNNKCLNSISFDDDSLSFSYENKVSMNYFHIKNLIIELDTQNDLHRLLTCLPQLKSIDVTIDRAYSKLGNDIEFIPISTLKYFRLQSFAHYWKLDELTSILKRIPNVTELIIEISISENDTRLINGQEMWFYISPLPLKTFSYFLQFKCPCTFDYTNIISTWQQFKQEFACNKIDDNNTLILYTLPFNTSNLTLEYQVAKNKIFLDNYNSQVKNFTLCDVSTRIVEIFPIINKCRQVQRLVLRVEKNITPKSVQQISLCKLPYLIFFVSLEKSSVDVNDFKQILEVSPNLYHLAVNYEFIKPLFDNESVCYLLEHRITHLLIGISEKTNLEDVIDSISRLSTIFPSLRHLYFHTQSNRQTTEPLILMVFNYLSKWNNLISFGVANAKIDEKILTKGIREWVIENSLLNDTNSFHTDYSDNTFRLWL